MAKAHNKQTAIERVAGTSPNLRAELLGNLRAIAPEAFPEGALDLDRLAELTGNKAAQGAERFSFTWAGRRDAIAMLQAPTSATLIPDQDASVNFGDAQHVFIEGENLETLSRLFTAPITAG